MAVHVKLCVFFFLTMQVNRCLLTRAQNFQWQNQGVSFAHFIKDPSVRLSLGKVNTGTLSVSRLGECTFECINQKGCFSVNLGRTRSADGKYTCELLKASKFEKAGKLDASEEFDHYYIETPCMSYPCQNGAVCRPSYLQGEEYICKCKAGFTGKFCERVNWIKMKPQQGHSSICFTGRGDTPGTRNFTSPSPGKIITFKLVHLYGGVSCLQGNISNWGCRNNFYAPPNNMLTLITDDQNNRLLPANDSLFGPSSCGEIINYSLPGYTLDSPQLIFDNFTSPLAVTKGQQFAVWFGEALYTGCGDSDNGIDQACLDVFGLFE